MKLISAPAHTRVPRNPFHLPVWVRHAMATWGGLGIFGIAFLDSFVFSFPFLMDLVVIELCLLNRARMPYYAAMATAGSLAGATALYFLSRKSGGRIFARRAGKRARRIRAWVDRHAFLSIFVPALLPPPFPFEPFIIAEGVFQTRLRTFISAVLAGRALRYFGEGMIAVFLGASVARLVVRHKLAFGLLVLAIIAAVYLAHRLLFSPEHGSEER